MLSLLGIGTIRNYAQLAAINHQTAGELLGLFAMKYRKKHHILIRAHEALHTAYAERRLEMSRATRAFVKDWARRWQKNALSELLWLTSPGRTKDTTSKVDQKRVKLRQEGIRRAVKEAFESLEW